MELILKFSTSLLTFRSDILYCYCNTFIIGCASILNLHCFAKHEATQAKNNQGQTPPQPEQTTIVLLFAFLCAFLRYRLNYL